MEVTFSKRGAGYVVRVNRDHGPELAPRGGPGGQSRIPHDAAHLIVETEAGLRGGVFGRIADANGLDGLFWAVDPGERRRESRRKRAPTAGQVADMERSEYLASLTVALWEVERGLRKPDSAWPGPKETSDVEPELLRRIFGRYDDFAGRWGSLHDGDGVTLTWAHSNS